MIWRLTLATGILGAAAILGAQAPGQQPPADRPAAQPAVEGNNATISGCLKPGASPGSFILSNAAMASAAPGGSAAPTIGTTGSTKSYNVVPKAAEDLSKHLNHKIEVTGTLAPSKPPSSAPAAAPPAADQPTETVTVQTFKMVAMACP
jgi:hypothetical protein